MEDREDRLPTGVVTFLLTDIESSTQLWEAHPTAMPDVLERHDRLVERIVAEHSGHLIKSKGEGDATMSVFRRATDAVAAAVDLQTALRADDWRAGVPLRVRMAIHTGEAHERDGDYFGPAVNRAARIRSVAKGGSLLLSEVAAGLVRDALPSETSLVDLGEQALRGLTRAERVFDLVQDTTQALTIPAGRVAPSRPPLPETIATPAVGLFVGRELELERLRTLLKEVTAGGLRAAFVAGEPGIGKTRLCSEFARVAHGDGAVVLYGRSDEEPLVPYQPFVESLRRWAAALSVSERANVPGADYLAPLVAELSDAARPLPAEDPEVARYKFFEAVGSALEHAALAGPVLLVLDDLHWADRPTLQLLQHMMRTRTSSPLLLLGTYRETDLSRTRPLAESLADFRRERAFERVALEGLAEEEIFALLERAATHDVGGAGRALARALSRTTDGNPFFIEQILGSLIETGRLAHLEGRWVLDARVEELGIPEGVIEAIGRRLSRLSESCNKALAAASVLGRDFEVDILTRVLERDPDEVLAAIEEALKVGLVRELPARGHAACTFSHALVQQALYEELSLARKQRLHLKAADAIEQTRAAGIEPYVTSLARHFRAAGAAADPEKAIDYSMRALEAASRVAAYEEGIGHGEAAMELIEDYGTAPERRARLHERLGDLHYVAGAEHERSFAHFRSALQAQTELGDLANVARIHLKLGRGQATFLDVGDINEALTHLRSAQRVLGPSLDPRLAGPLALGIAAASTYHFDLDEGSSAARQAMEIGRDQGSESVWATGAAFEGWALALQGRYDEARDLIEQAWLVADRLDNVLAAFAASWMRCEGYWYDPLEHSRLALSELDKPRQSQATSPRRMLRTTCAGALACAGRPREARGLLEDLPIDSTMGYGWIWFAHSFDDFVRMAREQGADLHARGHTRIYLGSFINLGENLRVAGSIGAAREAFYSALEFSAGRGIGEECLTNARLAILEAGERNVEAARENLARCDALLARGNGWRGCLGFVMVARAATAFAEGRTDEAENLFGNAIEIFQRYSMPFDEAEALRIWGRALADQSPSRALEKYDAALEIFTTREAGRAWIERVLEDRHGLQ